MKLKKLTSLLVCAVMCLSLVPAVVSAEEATIDTWDGTSDTSWYDETESEFHLTTAEQLAGLATLVNDGNTFAEKTIYLDNNLDLSGYEWTSIGTGSNAVGYFGGTFDGQGNVVSNLTNIKDGSGYYGLFGVVKGATIKNIGIENVTATLDDDETSLRIGLLMSWALQSEIKNCYTTGEITTNALGSKNVGGITGQAMAGTQIIGCYSSAVITSKAVDHSEAIGGIVGSWETPGDSPMISDCYFNGKIFFDGGGTSSTGLSTNVGGILGLCFYNEPNLVIKNCVVATKDVEAPSDMDIENGNGGMWIAWYEDTGMPTNCFWSDDGREWPAAIAFSSYINWIMSGYTNEDTGLYFDEAGSAVTDFTDPSILASLQENAEEGVDWVAGVEHPVFSWDKRNLAADYTAVDEALMSIPEDLSLYTDDSVKAVTDAADAVDRTLTLDRQSEVDDMAKAINDAVLALEYKPADYTAVDEAIAAAEALDSTLYSDFSAVTDAIEAVVRELDITHQEEVDDMAKAINDAVLALEYKPADYTAVDEAIAAAEALDSKLYSDFSAVTDAIEAVVRDLDITHQAEVDDMAKAINDAISALVLAPVTPDSDEDLGSTDTESKPDEDLGSTDTESKPDEDSTSTDTESKPDEDSSSTDSESKPDDESKAPDKSPSTGMNGFALYAIFILLAAAGGMTACKISTAKKNR